MRLDEHLYRGKLNRFTYRLKKSLNLEDVDLFGDIYDRSKAVNFDLSRVSVYDLTSFLNRYNVTIEAVLSDQVDFSIIKSKVLRGECLLPCRYKKGLLYSSRFTSSYMLQYIKREYGAATKKFVCQRYQLEDQCFLDAKARNNILLPRDICDYVHYYCGLDKVKSMGRESASMMRSLGMDQKIDYFNGRENLLGSFFEDFAPKYIEKNYHWKVEVVDSSLYEVSGSINLDLLNFFSKAELVSPSLEKLREGFLEGATSLLGFDRCKVYQIEKMSQGNSRDRYVIELC